MHEHDDSTRSFVTLTAGVVVSQFKIKRKIGAGGMGEVYLASDQQLNRHVALKFLPPAQSSDPSFRARFLREARSAAALNHPNIITIYEVGEFAERPYIAMEFLEGASLKDKVSEGKMSLHFALHVLIQAGLGLQRAHQQGIVHRDIKPDNIFVTEDGVVKVLDFGLAKGSEDRAITQAGVTMGTADYMSPEQAQGLDVDQRSDIFSMGVMLYEMLAGELPFRRPNIPATIYALVNEQPTPVSKVRPGVPPRLELICCKAMAKKPAERYQQITDFIADIREVHSTLHGGESGGVYVATQTATSEFSREALTVANVIDSPPVKTTSKPIISLAVLYLRNLGTDDDEFLSYGITEDLIVDLTRMSNLRVASMRSIMKFRDSGDDIEAIAEKLKVGLVLDGSIHRSNGHVRVSAQLIEVASDTVLWAERWEETEHNLSSIKQSLAQGISRTLGFKDSAVERAGVGSPETDNPHAYEYYLRGKYIFEHKKDTTDIDLALQLFQQALNEEPHLLVAAAGRARVFIHRRSFKEADRILNTALIRARQEDRPIDEAIILNLMAQSMDLQACWDVAKQRALQAIEIRRDLKDLAGEAEATGTLIQILMHRADFGQALRLWERVFEINELLDDQSKAAEALKNMGNVFHRQGNFNRARELYTEALELARKREDLALVAACTSNIGIGHFYQQNFDAAMKHYRNALDIDIHLDDQVGQATRYNNMAIVHLARGDYFDAQSSFDRAARIYDRLGDQAAYVLAANNSAGILTVLGQYDEAVVKITQLLDQARDLDYPMAICFASDYLGFAHLCKQEYTLAEHYLKGAIAVARKANLRRCISFSLSNLAEYYYQIDQIEQCRTAASKVLELATELNKPESILKAKAFLGYVAAGDGDCQTFMQLFDELSDEAVRQADPLTLLIIYRLNGHAHMICRKAQGRRETGMMLLQNGRDLAVLKGVQYEKEWIEHLLERYRTA